VAAPGLLDAADVVPSFPPPLDRYQGEAGLSLWGVLAHRVRVEPLSLVATGLFALAIVHTFLASLVPGFTPELRLGLLAGAALPTAIMAATFLAFR
jgi:hypothetical protein